jgi:hypothetical protein
MEIFIGEIEAGNLRIELFVTGQGPFNVVFTVKDAEDRRVIRAQIMENGEIKRYDTREEAIAEAAERFKVPLIATPPGELDRLESLQN